MGVGCNSRNYAVMVAMVSLVLMLMHNCVELEASGASVEGDMEVSFSPSKPMAVRLGEHLAMANDQRDEEFLEEMTRRMLATSTTNSSIGYNALIANRTPCTSTGKSYYNSNCSKSGSQGGPYTRSCTAATRCARG